MMKKPRKALLQSVTANSAGTGRVVFRTEDGAWSLSLADAAVVETDDDAAALLFEAQRDADANLVVDPYLIEVARTEAGLVATRLREAIRAGGGPTIDVPGARVSAAA